MEELIVRKARDLFFCYGLKSVSMDDIAKSAGISKKTIYKSFSDKNQLLQRLVDDLLACHKQAMLECSNNAKDAVDEILLLTQTDFNTITVINPAFFYELEKFFPSLWQSVTDHKQQVIVPGIIQNLHTGMLHEHYRQNLDIEFTAAVRLQQISTALHPASFSDKMMHNSRLLFQLSEFYLHSIATRKGKKLIEKYLNVNNEKQYSNYSLHKN